MQDKLLNLSYAQNWKIKTPRTRARGVKGNKKTTSKSAARGRISNVRSSN